MKTKCPKCRNLVEIDEKEQFADSPVAVCPKCKNVIFLTPVDDEALGAEVAGEEEARKGPIADIYGRPDGRLKRYLAGLAIMLVLFLGYQYSQSSLREEAAREGRLAQVNMVLKQLMAAQEEYYSGNARYADAIEQLTSFQSRPSVAVEIIRADGSSWAALGRNANHPEDCVAFNSARGGFQATCEGD
jgi:phage FluMu protein Com